MEIIKEIKNKSYGFRVDDVLTHFVTITSVHILSYECGSI